MRTLRETRHKLGMTLEDVSNQTGITIAQLSLIERGKGFPRLSTQNKLEEILGQQIDWIENIKVELGTSTNIVTQRSLRRFIQDLINLENEERKELIKITRKILTAMSR